MKRIIVGLLAAVLSVITFATPADAGGNVGCSAGSRNVGARACILTQWHTVSGGNVKMDSIEVYVGGDASTLEGGTCASNPAMTYDNLRIVGTDGDTKWGPQAPNEVCKPSGYSDTWSSSLDGLAPRNPNSQVCMTFHLRNNGGLDSTGAFCITVD